MAKAQTSTKTPDDPRKNWPTRSQVAQRLGISHRTIRRRQQTGELHPVFIDGIWHFDPEELEAIEPDEEQLDPITQFGKVIENFTLLLKQAHSHVEELLKPNKEVLDLFLAENISQRERIQELEERHVKTLELAEAVRSEQHQREMQRLTEERKEARKDWAIHQLQSFIPVIQQRMVANTLGGQLIGVVQSLREDQLQMLVQSGFFTEEQLQTVVALWRQAHPEPKAAEPAAAE